MVQVKERDPNEEMTGVWSCESRERCSRSEARDVNAAAEKRDHEGESVCVVFKKCGKELPDRELNPGHPRDRRVY